jgi:acyl-CoA synthetase (AMP-forming)/AMP-acid ligase II
MRSGNTPVPIDPEVPESGVEFMVSKSRAVAVLDPLPVREFERLAPSDYHDPSRPALVLFTSGTSGYPKGVLISHRNLMHSCDAIAEYLDYARWPSAAVVLPLHYSYALLSQVCCMLSVGGHVHLFPDLRNPLKFAQTVTAKALATFCGVPSTYHALCTFHRLSPLSMPAVRVLCSAGAAMDRSRYALVKQIFPNAVFFNNYGMTEAAPRISYARDDDPRFHEATCGRPMRGVEVKIVDPETFAELPEGQQGVLAVRGPNITSGYLNDPELTEKAFTPDRFLISGDAAYLDGAYIFIRGRYDDIFNVSGEKLAPLEIEHVLNHVPEVEMSAVAGFPDEQRGMAPVAFLKLRTPQTRRGLVQELMKHLPKVKIPQRYFEVSGFPMTSNGKLQRKRLSPNDPAYVVREIV